MRVLCVTGCGRHSVSAEVPGTRAATVNDLGDHRCDNEVHLCCLREGRNAFTSCAQTRVAVKSAALVNDSSFDQHMETRFYSEKYFFQTKAESDEVIFQFGQRSFY